MLSPTCTTHLNNWEFTEAVAHLNDPDGFADDTERNIIISLSTTYDNVGHFHGAQGDIVNAALASIGISDSRADDYQPTDTTDRVAHHLRLALGYLGAHPTDQWRTIIARELQAIHREARPNTAGAGPREQKVINALRDITSALIHGCEHAPAAATELTEPTP